MQQVLCDTAVFLSMWSPNETAVQEIFSKQFFQKSKECKYAINVLDSTRREIYNKFPFLIQNYFSLCEESFKLKKFKEYSASSKKEILLLKQNSQKKSLNLSFNDCALIFAAQKLKMPLISWDKQLIEFAKQQKVNTLTPQDCD